MNGSQIQRRSNSCRWPMHGHRPGRQVLLHLPPAPRPQHRPQHPHEQGQMMMGVQSLALRGAMTEDSLATCVLLCCNCIFVLPNSVYQLESMQSAMVSVGLQHENQHIGDPEAILQLTARTDIQITHGYLALYCVGRFLIPYPH